jgi:hypothetical protein
MALAPLGAMAPLEMNGGTHYFQGSTKGLSVRPRCIGAALSLHSGSLTITEVTEFEIVQVTPIMAFCRMR